MDKRSVLNALCSDAKARPALPTRDTGERVAVRWPKYRKAAIYEGHPLPNTYDAHAHLSMGHPEDIAEPTRYHTGKPATIPQGFHDPRDPKLDAEQWHEGSKPVTVIPFGLDRSLATQRVRRMKPKTKQQPKAKAVEGTINWDIQYRPDLPADWSEQARKRNWDCLSRHISGKPTLREAKRLLTVWRLLDSRIIVDIDDKRKTRDVWFKIPPRSSTPKLGRIADDGISGR